MAEHHVTRFHDVAINLQADARLGEQSHQQYLPPLNGFAPQVIAVKLDQVEGVEEDVSILTAVAQSVEARHPIGITGNRFAIDQARRSLERERGASDQWEPAGPVIPVPGEKPHAAPVAAHQHSEAVVFDFVQPSSPSGRLRGWARQARLAEVGKGTQIPQHGRYKCGTRRPESNPNLRMALPCSAATAPITKGI
jgi:hypothetical protein